jgi:hypothetical protein
MKSSRLRRWQLINNGRDEARRRTLSVRRMSKNHTGWIEDPDPIALSLLGNIARKMLPNGP